MQPQEFKVREYLSRIDLEKAIISECGNDIKINKDTGHSITGTPLELKEFNLDDTSSIWGVRCVFDDKKDSSKERLKKVK